VFIVGAVTQMLIRDRVRSQASPISLLSIGDLGWIQITNFVVGGLLFVAATVGLRWSSIPAAASPGGVRVPGEGACVVKSAGA
jgi:hypothetical protein